MRLRAVVAALAVAAFPAPAWAQADDVLSLSEALADRNGDAVADRLGETVLVEGLVIAPPVDLGAFGSYTVLQGGPGAVIFAPSGSTFADVRPGMRVRVRGTVSQSEGQENITVAELEVRGGGPLPPVVALRSADAGAAYAGRLVEIQGTLYLMPERGQVLGRVVDATGSIPVYFPPTLLADPDRFERILASHGKHVTLQGVLLRSARYGTGPDDGYYLMPAEPQHLFLPAVPLYAETATGVVLVVLALLAAYLWRKRRGAERHAADQRAVADRLKESESALRDAKERLRHLLQTSPSIIYANEIRNGVPRTVWISENVTWILGYSTEGALEKGWFTASLHPDDRERVLEQFRDFLLGITGTDQLACEYRVLHKDGTYRWSRNALRIVARHDWGAEAVGAAVDITAEKEATLAVAEAEARVRWLGAVLESLNHGVAIVAGATDIVFANSSFRQLLGLPAEGDPLPPFDDLLPDEPARLQLDEIAEALRARGRWSGRVWRRRLDDARAVPLDAVVGLVPGAGDGPHLTVMICEDATEKMLQEQQIRRAERLSSLGTLVGGVAHELNNPLNAIINFAVLLLSQEGRPEGDREDLETIVREGERAANIVAKLRTIASEAVAAESAKAPVDLNEVVAHVVKLRRYTFDTSNVVLELRQDPALAPVHGDRRQLEQVVLNLVVNAEHAMVDHRGGGSLLLETRVGPLGATLIVQDDGPGIPSNHLERIFDPFFTTKDPGKGTGLGLSLVHNIVTEHGGAVSVHPRPGGGVAFQVDLPLARRAPAAPHPAPDPVPEPRPRRLRVLLVDDEPAVRRSIARFLERQGHTVTEAAEGGDALRRLDDAEAYDIILSDLRMPGMGGEDLVRRLRQDGRGLDRHVVLMSGDAGGVEGSAALHGIPVLLKPLGIREIEEAILSHAASVMA